MNFNLDLSIDELMCLMGYLNTVYYLQKDSDKNLIAILKKIQVLIDDIKKDDEV
jgi:hypothetical protein